MPMGEKSIKTQIVLAAFLCGEDRASLTNILGNSPWKLQFTSTLRETQRALGMSPAVVMSEIRLPDGGRWNNLLYEIQQLECPPPLILADRLADEHLWAEVLNLGGYDLLAKPFDAKEVLRAITMASLHAENEREMARRRKSTMAARYGSLTGMNADAAIRR
jgi:DNA-binding NtrC family response regulator